MNYILTWYVLGLIGVVVINHYEVNQINKDIERMGRESNYTVCYLGGVPKIWHGLLVAMFGAIPLLMAIHLTYIHHKYN